MQSEQLNLPVTGSEKKRLNLSNEIYLFQNYPDPFTMTTFISFTIPDSPHTHNQFQRVTLKIFDSSGKEISSLLNDHRLPGYYDIEFSRGDLPAGTYYYELIVGSFHREVKKMNLQN